MTRGGAATAAVAVAAAAAALLALQPAALTECKLWALHGGALALFTLCGMSPDRAATAASAADGATRAHNPVSLYGEPWRACFERVIPSSPAGSWGGVASTDVCISTPAGGGGGDAVKDAVPCAGTNATHMLLRVYVPDHAPTGAPLLVYYHGGGYTIGHPRDRDMDRTLRDLAKVSGWVIVAPDYRLAPEHPFPQGVHDAYAAAVWVSACVERHAYIHMYRSVRQPRTPRHTRRTHMCRRCHRAVLHHSNEHNGSPGGTLNRQPRGRDGPGRQGHHARRGLGGRELCGRRVHARARRRGQPPAAAGRAGGRRGRWCEGAGAGGGGCGAAGAVAAPRLPGDVPHRAHLVRPQVRRVGLAPQHGPERLFHPGVRATA